MSTQETTHLDIGVMKVLRGEGELKGETYF